MTDSSLQTTHPDSYRASRKSLQLLRDLIEKRTGIFFPDPQLELLAGKLTARATELSLHSFLDYYYLLKYDPAGQDEWPVVESLVTVNESYFWRDPEPLQMAARMLVPQLHALLGGKRPVRIWHAGCAGGEEPFSLAMALQEERCNPASVEVLATDLDLQVLEKARRGLYRERSLRCLPAPLRERYFKVQATGEYELDSELRARVQFRTLNLVDARALAELRDIDLIYCRNVLTYFRDPTLERIAEAFYRILTSPGHLFLGASESFLRFRTPFQFAESDGLTWYRKSAEGSR